jgi:kinesin family protein 6/9
MRNNLIEIDQNLTALKTSLLQKFEQWFFKKYGISISDIENPLINQKNED